MREFVEPAVHRSETFVRFLDSLRTGDCHASAELVSRYAERLRNLAAQHLGARLRPKVDPDDILQSAMCSFFVGVRQGKWDLESSQNLRNLLCMIVVRKCWRQVDRYGTQGRSMHREYSLSGDVETTPIQLACPSKSAEEQVIEADLLSYALNLVDPTDRRVLQLIVNGHSTASVAQQVGYSQRTIQRIMLRFLKRLSESAGDDR